jgi:hypothetical protein
LAWLTQHSGALVTTCLLSIAFFRLFVRPAVGTNFEDSALFVFTSSLAHTWMVAIGFAFAERAPNASILVISCICFCTWASVLWLAYTSHVGRFRHWAESFALDDAKSASMVGAGSLTTWLAVSMTVPRSNTGRRLAAGTFGPAHLLITSGAVLLLVIEVTPLICLATILGGYAAALAAEGMLGVQLKS